MNNKRLIFILPFVILGTSCMLFETLVFPVEATAQQVERGCSDTITATNGNHGSTCSPQSVSDACADGTVSHNVATFGACMSIQGGRYVQRSGSGFCNDSGVLFHYEDRTAPVSNSTFSGARGRGSRIYNTEDSLTVLNSMLVNNFVDSSGDNIYTDFAAFSMGKSIVADGVNGRDCEWDVTDLRHNHIDSSGSDACELVDDVNNFIIGQDPTLGPLADNGGPTFTRALLPTDSAVGEADQAICGAAPINGLKQSGFLRDADRRHDAHRQRDRHAASERVASHSAPFHRYATKRTVEDAHAIKNGR